MFWGCFAATGRGRLIKVTGNTKKEDCVKFLNENLKDPARELSLGRRWCFTQDNDPKHSANLTKKWLEDNNINILEWPSPSRTSIPLKICGGFLN